MKKGKTKRLLSFLLSFIMVVSMCFTVAPAYASAADKLTFTVTTDDEDGKVERGDQITVSVGMSGNTEAFGLTYSLYYDTAKLALVGDPAKGEAFKNFGGMEFDECWKPEDGEVLAFMVRSAAITNGNLMTMTFKVLEDAEVGEIGFNSEIELSGEYGEDVAFDCVDNTNLKVVFPLKGIALDKTAATINKGETTQLTVTYDPESTTDDKTVRWTSSNTNVATVDANGLVTAVGVGSATITATVGEFEATCTVKVVSPLSEIRVDKTSHDLVKNKTVKITYTILPEDTTDSKEVTFTSDNEKVATVDAEGNVKALSEGTAVVTLTGASGAKATVTIHVTEIHISSVTLDKTEATAATGDKIQLTASVGPANHTDDNRSITWASSDPSVATVDANGLVTAVGGGRATITAATWNKVSASFVLTVPVPLESIAMNKTETTIARGGAETLSVTVKPSNTTDDTTATWTSSDEKIVTVDADGKVTAVGIGKAVVTAKVGAFTAECEVTVNAPLESIEVSETLDMVKNQTATIEYRLNPSDTTDNKAVTFKSDDEKVATVDENGVVTAKKAGTAVITITSVANTNITAAVTVNVREIPIDEIVLNKVNATVEKGDTVQLTAIVKPEDHTDDDDTITWTSSDESVATVDANGLVTAVGGGKATITATTVNGTYATCEILVPIHMEAIALSGTTEIDRNQTTILNVIYTPDNTTDDKVVTWSSSDEEVATVDPETGMIRGLKEGTTVITATTTGTTIPLEASATVTVKENHLTAEIAEEIIIEKPENGVLKGQTVGLGDGFNLSVILEENRITDDITVEWSSSDENVATVDHNGVVTGVKEGTVLITATIKATDADGVTVTYTVNAEVDVKEIPLESIAFAKEITELKVGESGTLVVVYTPDNTTDPKTVEWLSSDESVLTVKDGVITGVKEGTAEVTAKVGDLKITCKVTVKPAKTTPDQTTNTDKTGTVQTGDTANTTLYVVLLAAAAAVILIFSKKRIFVRNR